MSGLNYLPSSTVLTIVSLNVFHIYFHRMSYATTMQFSMVSAIRRDTSQLKHETLSCFPLIKI